MPFDSKHNELYNYAIKTAITELGHQCTRADEANGPRNIINDIISSIYNCDIVIAVLTDFNPNVFYELGVAHCFGNKTIMLCEKDLRLPFDLQSYHVVFYENGIDGLTNVLKNQLKETINNFDLWSTKPNNPIQDFIPKLQFHKPLSQLNTSFSKIAGESIPENSVVYIDTDGKIYLASPFILKGTILGICNQSYQTGDECTVFTSGEVAIKNIELIPSKQYYLDEYKNNSNIDFYNYQEFEKKAKDLKMENFNLCKIGTATSEASILLNIDNILGTV